MTSTVLLPYTDYTLTLAHIRWDISNQGQVIPDSEVGRELFVIVREYMC